MSRSRGRAGQTQSWPIPKELWLVRPSQETSVQRESVAKLRQEAAACSDVQLEEVRTTRHIGHQGRHTQILSPSDLRKLYVRCHRAHVWVAAVGGVHVRRDPSAAVSPKNLSTLEQVVRYKVAGYFLISRPAEALKVAEPLTSSLASAWSSHHDPRCLPMHAFSPDCPHDLSSVSGQEQFSREYRHRSSRGGGMCMRDQWNREWQVDPSMHGADSLHTRGLYLPTGFHWDVQTGRKRSSFTNGWECWETVNFAHLNVHPDGYVRAPHARRAWSWETAQQKCKQAHPQ